MSNVLWQEPGGCLIFLPDDESEIIADCKSPDWAHRITDCVNACAGIETAQLENILTLGDSLKGRFFALTIEQDELIEQRDKLIEWMRRIESEPINAEYFAREAINEIESAK